MNKLNPNFALKCRNRLTQLRLNGAVRRTNFAVTKFGLIFLLAFLLFFPIINGCSDHLLDRFSDPIDDGSLDVWSGSWLIFDDKLNTNGDLMLGPLDDNQELKEVEDSFKGDVALKYSWDGEQVAGKDFCYASFIVATDYKYYDETPGKNLTYAGYTKITFYAKGKLRGNTRVEFKGPWKAGEDADNNTVMIVPGDETPESGQKYMPPLSEDTWQPYEIDITDSDLTEVKDYFIIAFVGEGDSEGGRVLVDEIKYD